MSEAALTSRAGSGPGPSARLPAGVEFSPSISDPPAQSLMESGVRGEAGLHVTNSAGNSHTTSRLKMEMSLCEVVVFVKTWGNEWIPQFENKEDVDDVHGQSRF